MPKQQTVAIRAFLEMDDGTFCTAEKVLQSPELQKRCIEQRELKKIMRLLERYNLKPAELARLS